MDINERTSAAATRRDLESNTITRAHAATTRAINTGKQAVRELRRETKAALDGLPEELASAFAAVAPEVEASINHHAREIGRLDRVATEQTANARALAAAQARSAAAGAALAATDADSDAFPAVFMECQRAQHAINRLARAKAALESQAHARPDTFATRLVLARQEAERETNSIVNLYWNHGESTAAGAALKQGAEVPDALRLVLWTLIEVEALGRFEEGRPGDDRSVEWMRGQGETVRTAEELAEVFGHRRREAVEALAQRAR